jgi:sporulation protein YtfJ
MAESQSKMESFIKSMLEELRQMATTETIVGQPVTIEDKTVLPVIKFSVGFGAGGGEGTGEGLTSKEESKTGKGTGYGQGGGGGIRIDPVAFVTVHDGKVMLLPITKSGANVERLLESIPDFIDKVRTMRGKKEEKK